MGSDYPMGTWERVTLLLLLTISVSTLSSQADVFWYFQYLPRLLDFSQLGIVQPSFSRLGNLTQHCGTCPWN